MFITKMAQDLEEVVVGDKTFRIVSELGKGGQAVVKKAYDSASRKKVALKIMWKEFVSQRQRERMLHNVKIEITAMRNLRHQNIIQLYGYDLSSTYKNRECIVLVQELAKCGELFEYVQHTGGFEDLLAKKIFKDLMSGLDACHRAGVAHRDLKPENILLDKKYCIKIADFGFVNFFRNNETQEERRMRTRLGTRTYMAPEIELTRNYTQAVDIWSSGVILFILCSGYPPFKEPQDGDWFFNKLDRRKYQMFWAAHERRFTFPDVVKPLVEGMLCTNPDNRWTAQDCLNCEWMTNGEELEERDYRITMQDRRDRIDAIRNQARPVENEQTPSATRMANIKKGGNANRALEDEKEGVVVFEAAQMLNNSWRDRLRDIENEGSLREVFGLMAEENPKLSSLAEVEIINLEATLEHLHTLVSSSDVQQCIELDDEKANEMLELMRSTLSDRPWDPIFQQYINLENDFPLELHDKWVKPTLFSFDTMLGYGLLCVLLAEFAEGKGEMEVDPDNRTIDLTFETEKTQEIPTDETCEAFEEITVDVVLTIRFSLYRVERDGELIGNKLLVQQVSQDFAAQDDFKWIVNEIASMDDFIVARIDPE